MNIVNAQQKSRHGWRRSGARMLVDDVNRRMVPSPMLTPGGGVAKVAVALIRDVTNSLRMTPRL